MSYVVWAKSILVIEYLEPDLGLQLAKCSGNTMGKSGVGMRKRKAVLDCYGGKFTQITGISPFHDVTQSSLWHILFCNLCFC